MWWREVKELAGMVAILALLGVAGISLSQATSSTAQDASVKAPAEAPVEVKPVSSEFYEAGAASSEARPVGIPPGA